jgi:hypothetical protein
MTIRLQAPGLINCGGRMCGGTAAPSAWLRHPSSDRSLEPATAKPDYNHRMTTAGGRGIFSLNQAQALLPQVKHLTADAVRQAESLAVQLHGLAEDDPEHVSLSAALKAVVDGWAGEVQSLGLEAKGLWLVDFDNGEGYYCWCYPEETVTHYHGYEDGFKGRMKIQ